MTYDIDFDEMMSYFKIIIETDKEITEDNYMDIKHDAIEDYVSNNDYENKDLVNKYGVFKALKLYIQNFGEFDFERNESNMYATLAYIIISDKFDDKYPDYTDMLNAIKELETEEISDSECDECNHCGKCVLNELSTLAIHCN